MCKNEHCYAFVSVDGWQLVIEFNAKSKILLKPLVGAKFMRNEFDKKQNCENLFEILNTFQQA